MGAEMIAVAQERAWVEPLFDRLQQRQIGGRFIQWRGGQLRALLAGRSARSVAWMIPFLSGHELVAIMDFLNAERDVSMVAIAAEMTTEHDTKGLFSNVLPRTLIVDLRGQAKVGPYPGAGELPGSIWNGIVDLALRSATGIWELTDDGVLVPSANPLGTSSVLPIALGRRAVPGPRTMDGAARIR